MTNENKVVEYYDSIAKDYDDSRFNNSYGQFIDSQERRTLDRLISTADGTLRLEMACGTGRLTNYATHGLDASDEMMSLARQRHPNVEFRQASAADTGFADNTFDVVYTFHLLMHLDETTIQQIFDEAWRILKPGGRFIFDIPSKRRRNLLHHKQTTWHGATSLDRQDVERMAHGNFDLRSCHGVMMLPVHKLPRVLRKPLQKTDYLMANGWLRKYSSYLIFELQKH
ncbi:MAG: class I SAM-dependent methyltransferase [Bacteroidaceae bacterium]|nr:class I SAM-dependent methyltransferase [Bacteroidaceae bacterium]